MFLSLKERLNRKKRKEKPLIKKSPLNVPLKKKKKGLPDMPDSPDELQEELSKKSEENPSSGLTTEVTEELAGDLINIPFEVWSSFNPVVLPLSLVERRLLAGPFSRILEKYGMGKIAKDEIVFAFYLTAFGYGRYKAVRAAKPKKEIKADVRDDSRKAGPGQDDIGKTDLAGTSKPVPGPESLHSGLPGGIF